MIDKKKVISVSASEKSINILYSVVSSGFFVFLFGGEIKYYIINIFSSEKLPPSPVLLSEVLELVEQKEKYQDNRLKHGFKYSILPLVQFPKLSFRIKEITKTDFEKLENN